MSTELISVIICTYNRSEMLDSALRSLKEQQASPNVHFEIVVVDDGSADSTQLVVRTHLLASTVPIRYVRQEHAGIAAARNRGFLASSGSWIAFFDDDQIAASNWLVRLFDKATTEDVDIVGGPCLLRLTGNGHCALDPTIRRLLGENPRMMQEGIYRGRGWDPRKRAVIPGTGNVLVKRIAFERVGLFNESRKYGEDREFFVRAMKARLTFAVANAAVVYHVVPSSRLTARYLLNTAMKGGQTLAEIDQSASGRAFVLWNACLRLAHFFVVTLPGFGRSWLCHNHASMLARRCSARFTMEYIAVALAGQKRASKFLPD